ncbi:FadR/GntR family transcriptional regulator [Sediminispirochaeta bajacaliforniensis]|uniref:FadR/GntR family transcriptional regulator n=1 Tax=Sediminispirochaeta bajacaliforniensis TaxID=148 RepID=UPI00037E1EA8|nr:FadR/GntR family transcriptional regulator [Sediminispirochaeta bajacaliforniensis]
MDSNSWLSNPVEKGSVSRIVLERIKEALINKQLRPGDFLPTENELAKGFGVGKSSIREAIKMLEAMGVVEIRRGQGTVIREHPDQHNVNSLVFQLLLQEGDVQELIDLRAMFEVSYTTVAMHRATVEDLQAIKLTINDFEAKIKKGEHELEDDLAFHRAILASTHNVYIIKIGETILQLFRSSIRKSVAQTPEIALDDHKRIFKAFCEKDETAIKTIIYDTLERWRENLS